MRRKTPHLSGFDKPMRKFGKSEQRTAALIFHSGCVKARMCISE